MPPQVAFTPNTAPATSAAAAVRTSMTASASYASRSVQQQQQVHHGGQQQQQGLCTPVMQRVPTTAASPQYHHHQQQPGMVGHALPPAAWRRLPLLLMLTCRPITTWRRHLSTTLVVLLPLHRED